MAKTSPIGTVVNLLFPIDCAVCGRESGWLCPDCLKKYQRIRLLNCFICGHLAEAGICKGCSERTALDGIVSIFPYNQPEIRRLIKAAKYDGARDALEFLAKSFRQKILRLLPDEIDAVAFTPSTKAKEKERGYNPAAVVAGYLADDEISVRALFEKVKDIPSQTGLTKKKRQKNVRGAYRLKKGELPETLIIVDDVITTGATLGALARLAKRRRVRAVWAVTICHG